MGNEADANANAGDETSATTSTATSSESTASAESDALASARKRQAGSEAARQAAEGKLADAIKELETLRGRVQTEDDKEKSELVRLQERLTAAEKRAADADSKAEARILDARFPSARKELPEVTDEVRLAKFEAMLADTGEAEPPTPRGNSAARSSAPSKTDEEKTSEDLIAEIRGMALPDWWPGQG